MAHNLGIEFIDAANVAKLLKWKDLIPAVEQGMKNFSDVENGGVVQPVRSTLLIEDLGFKMVMPCYTRAEGALATKIITSYDKKNELGLPVHSTIIIYFDWKTGIPKAVMDGEVVTAMRTAAATVVATKYLTTSKPKSVAILGAGVQGKSHIQAFNFFFKLDEIRVWNRTYEKALKLIEEIKKTEDSVPSIKAYVNVADAVENVDVIATVSGSSTPILKAELVKPGTLVNVVGGNKPTSQEVDPKLMQNSTVYVDTIAAAIKESGDIIKSNVKIEGEVGEIISGKKKLKSNGTIVCKLQGMAVEDAVSAKIVYDKYMELKTNKKS